jgi:hypothetical protein
LSGSAATWYGGPLGHNKLAKIVGIHCARTGQPTPAGGLGTFIAHSLSRTCLTNGENSGVVNGDTSLMAAGGHTTKEGLKSFLGIDSYERENITAGAFYGRGAAGIPNMLAARLSTRRPKSLRQSGQRAWWLPALHP